MALIVQKYGGTSVGTLDRISAVAEKIVETQSLGHELVVVVSAMAGETDRLLELAHQISPVPDPRELDVLLSTGEQVTIALLSLALLERGCRARSYTGGQVAIRTDNVYNKARILGVDAANIQADLSLGTVVIVAGFQGIDEAGNMTTLGRGGSDTTAVALAAALNADECQIYTDVDGVYTTDPKMVKEARRLSQITVDEMLEMASNGAKVMQLRAVEFARHSKIPVRVLSTFEDGVGTLITNREGDQLSVISGIAFNRDEAKFVIHGIADKPGVAANIFSALSAAHIEVDMIVQTLAPENTVDLAFTVHQRDFNLALPLLQKVVVELGAKGLMADEHVAKVSLVGIGLRSHAGIASQLFQVLGACNINIQLVSTSEIKISVVLEEKCLEQAVRALHESFALEMETKEIAVH